MKLLVDCITDANRESVRNAEKELHNLHLKDYDHNMSKAVMLIRTTIKTLEANRVISSTLTSDIITALCNNTCYEDYRLDAKFHENNHDKGKKIDVQSILTSLEKKHTKLIKSNK